MFYQTNCVKTVRNFKVLIICIVLYGNLDMTDTAQEKMHQWT